MSFSTQEISDYAGFARRLRDAARQQTLPRFRTHTEVTNKAETSYDPVTDADREAERVQREMIAADYPDHAMVGEEFGTSGGDGPWRWVMDPIDGTRAFVCGVPTWTTLIALEYDRRPVIGLIDQPYIDECWIGVNGVTRFYREGGETLCETSGVKDLAQARLSTTDPRSSEYFSQSEADAFERLAHKSRLTRFSMDAYAYALLASGEIDLVVEIGLKHHDYAALVPVVEGAGGVITSWGCELIGSDAQCSVIAAATPELHQQAIAVLAG